MVKLIEEKGYERKLVAEDLGVGASTADKWVRAYRACGEDGLKDGMVGAARRKLHPSVKKKITDVKKANPGFGVRRICDLLKRFFFIPASPEAFRGQLPLLTPRGVLDRLRTCHESPGLFFPGLPHHVLQRGV